MSDKPFSHRSTAKENIAGQIPVISDPHDNWLLRVSGEREYRYQRYAAPNRRDYYKIVIVTDGSGKLAVGSRVYDISAPSLICLHPRDIISWTVGEEDGLGAQVLYLKEAALQQPAMKSLIDHCRFFQPEGSRVFPILTPADELVLADYFSRLQSVTDNKATAFEFILGYLQLLLVEIRQRCTVRMEAGTAASAMPVQVHQFFELLERETAQLSSAFPLRIKTAKEFANELSVHPNYLNSLVKKYTGQNISTQIRNRLVEESRTLLVQTNWTIKDISFTVGFSDPPNFTCFFRNCTGQTPAEYRKSSRII